ncbi:hypothetical protein PIB30_053534 [Stylosanthes scabra]|uniref:Uncharacterized protein n=1 Tax=Stylosanthes scabra TaxID=79078 RepID=A0ABU6WI35_9FABA|nr:hypothetical protein [Stylosanthes scabra]
MKEVGTVSGVKDANPHKEKSVIPGTHFVVLHEETVIEDSSNSHLAPNKTTNNNATREETARASVAISSPRPQPSPKNAIPTKDSNKNPTAQKVPGPKRMPHYEKPLAHNSDITNPAPPRMTHPVPPQNTNVSPIAPNSNPNLHITTESARNLNCKIPGESMVPESVEIEEAISDNPEPKPPDLYTRESEAMVETGLMVEQKLWSDANGEGSSLMEGMET